MKVKELRERLKDFADDDDVEIEVSHDEPNEDGVGRMWPVYDVFCISGDKTIIRTDY